MTQASLMADLAVLTATVSLCSSLSLFSISWSLLVKISGSIPEASSTFRVRLKSSSLACWDAILSVMVLRREVNSEKMNCVQPAWWHFLKNCEAGLVLDPEPDESGGPESPGDPEPQLESVWSGRRESSCSTLMMDRWLLEDSPFSFLNVGPSSPY